MPRLTIGLVTDFLERRGVAVNVGPRRLAIFRVGADVFAIDDVCPHRGFPLHDGSINDGRVSCRTHGSCFNLQTGVIERGPATRGVAVYAAAIVDDHVEVEIPD
jgi:anthranilate 1,2-dioxygenase ferredoxin subunit